MIEEKASDHVEKTGRVKFSEFREDAFPLKHNKEEVFLWQT